MFGYQTSRKDAKFVDQHDATIICFCQGSIELPGVNKVILHKSRVEQFFFWSRNLDLGWFGTGY